MPPRPPSASTRSTGVKLVTEALDTVRRATWNELRALPDQAAGQEVQRRPLGAAQTTRAPHRGAVEHAAQAAPLRRGPVAGLQPQRGIPGDLRWRPRRRADHRAARPLVLEGQPLPTSRVCQGRQDHPQVPRRHPRRHPPRGEQRPRRRTQQPRPPHHPTRLRVPFRQGSARPGDALLRTNRATPAPRKIPMMIHTHAGRAPKRGCRICVSLSSLCTRSSWPICRNRSASEANWP